MSSELYPFPPRYFFGWVKLESGVQIAFPDCIMFPYDKQTMRLFPRNPAAPFSGEYGLPGACRDNPIREIQYAISCIDRDCEHNEHFNHPFNRDDSFLLEDKNLGIVIHSIDRQTGLLKLCPMDDIFPDVSKARWPVTQFVG